MFHTKRIWQTPQDVSALTPEEFADTLTQQSWTSCSAWQRNGLAYLNDSTGPDGAFEVAVVEVDESDDTELSGAQIESITFGWMDTERAAGYIRELDSGEYESAMNQPVTADLHTAEARCYSCA